MKKAIIYCRVSSQKQVVEGHGLEGQEKRCKDYAENKGYSVIKVFKEKGISGGLIDRPDMQKLLSYLDDHKEEEHVVVIDDIKRLARDIQGHFTLKAAIYSRNSTLESPSHRFEDTPEGKFIETVLAGASELERNQNARQVKNRMKTRLENGYWPFRSPPTGLRYKKEPLHGKILRNDEPFASIFKEAIESYEKRILMTYEDVQGFILQKYKEQNINRPLSLQGAKEILEEVLYCGYIEHKKWAIPLQKGKHDGFISFETYSNVQKILQSRYKIHSQRKDFNSDFPLRPYVLCVVCNKPMTAAWCKGNGGKYAYYWCKTKSCPRRGKMVSRAKIEGDFEPFLQSVSVNKEVTDLTETIFLKTWKEEKDKELADQTFSDSRKEELRNKIKSQAERISSLKDSALISVYEEQIKGYLAQIEELEKNKIKRNYNEEEFQTASAKVFSVLKEPIRMWKSKEYKNKTTILQMYFERKLVYDLEKGFQTVRLAPPIELINSIDCQENTLVEMGGIEPPSEKTLLKNV